MILSLSELRRRISALLEQSDDCWGGSHPEELYEEELEDDPELKKHSVLVPDDIKKSISKWSKSMGLSGTKNKRAR